MKNNSGVSLVTLVVTIVVMLILAGISMRGTTSLINKTAESKKTHNEYNESEIIRKLLTDVVLDKNLMVGIPLQDGIFEVRETPTDKNPDTIWYGTNYYLIPGGNEEEIKKIISKTGDDSIEQYREFTGSYVVDYVEGKFERINVIEIR